MVLASNVTPVVLPQGVAKENTMMVEQESPFLIRERAFLLGINGSELLEIGNNFFGNLSRF